MMSTPLRVGIVGCGNVSLNFHVPAYQAAGDRYRIVALADPSAERVRSGRAATGLTARDVYADIADMLSRSDIDVVDVCTPQHLHRDAVLRALSAGKHVLCEKPIAVAPADAAAMVTAARRARRVLGIVHNYLFLPEVVALMRLCTSGEIGEVRTVRIDMLGVVDSPGAASYRPQWRKDPTASGGGVLMDMLHGIYLAEHLLQARASAVSAFVDTVCDGDAVEGLALCRLEAGRRAALVNIGWGHGPGGIAVHGTRGRACVRYRDDGTIPWAPFERLTVTSDGRSRMIDLPPGQELAPLITTAMCDTVVNLADAIVTDVGPAADGAAALHTLELVVAAYASAALQRTVAVPLDVGDPLFAAGVAGLAALDIPQESPVRQRGLFGLTERGA